MNKKWSKMTTDEKLDILLEWADKTHKKLTETINVINEITNHLNDYNGQALPFLKEDKKYEV